MPWLMQLGNLGNSVVNCQIWYFFNLWYSDWAVFPQMNWQNTVWGKNQVLGASKSLLLENNRNLVFTISLPRLKELSRKLKLKITIVKLLYPCRKISCRLKVPQKARKYALAGFQGNKLCITLFRILGSFPVSQKICNGITNKFINSSWVN